jgi:serine/threonine-protein kinase
VYDTCSDDGHEAIVMELLDGVTLRQHLDDNGPLDADTTVRIALRLLDALEAAHRAGLVHRDVKPSNILLCRDGRVKIADFGIAKSDDHTELTQDGTLVGTASYLAPEQLLGGSVDARADLYSLGIVLYECLTGRVPFDGDTGAAVALPRVAAAVMRALARDPADRFDTAGDLRAALLDTGHAPPPGVVAAGAPVAAHEDGPPVESFARSERSWLVPTLFILLIATALVVAGLLLRDTSFGTDDAPGPTAPPTTLPPPTTLRLVEAIPHDPQGRGRPGENDRLAPRAIDGDPASAWRTESYDPPGLGPTKTGVGLAVFTDGSAELTRLGLDASTNGWSARVYALDDDALADGLASVDPDSLEPVAEVTDVRGPIGVDLSPSGPADALLIWITDLGEPVQGGRHRVEIAEVVLEGRPVR